MKFVDRPTPNLSKRTKAPRFIILHHDGGTAAGSVAWLTNPASKRSSDFLVARDGTIYKLNPQLSLFYTWHAGSSAFGGFVGLNSVSFGVEQEHKVGQDWPLAQIRATAKLCKWLVARYNLPDGCIQSHRAVAVPRGRKIDPENYPWDLFSREFWSCEV